MQLSSLTHFHLKRIAITIFSEVKKLSIAGDLGIYIHESQSSLDKVELGGEM
jgi:hypothetical protein